MRSMFVFVDMTAARFWSAPFERRIEPRGDEQEHKEQRDVYLAPNQQERPDKRDCGDTEF